MPIYLKAKKQVMNSVVQQMKYVNYLMLNPDEYISTKLGVARWLGTEGKTILQ